MLLIALGGTIASLIAVALGRGEREGSSYPLVYELPAGEPESAAKPEEAVQPDKKPPAVLAARQYLVELREDKTFWVTAVVKEKEARKPLDFPSLEKFLEEAAPEGGPRPFVRLFTTSAQVTRDDLEQVATQLRPRCDVVIQSRAPEKSPQEK